MFSNKLYSPLRYPGGKARFAPYISHLMCSNGLEAGHYLEPYAGGAGVALELLFHGVASHAHINDLDPAVHAFWVAVTQHSKGLLRLLDETPINMEQWFHWRSVLREELEVGAAERGFATLFMNRTNRSGILKGGVIGGKAQSGDYKLDARLNKDVLAARIENIAKHSANITVYCEDAKSLLKRCHRFLPLKSLVYLDPPYFVKGQGLYRNFYCAADHVAIAKLLQSTTFRRPWVVSYDNAPEIREMYRASPGFSYDLNYTAQAKYQGEELMRFKSGMEIPELRLGARIA
jgi:DNA adenine methylase